jgi:two-component system KDP operon response regulator KdpE
VTILLIEDNRQFSQFIELSLTEADVHVVETLESAKGWLSTFRADLILVDLGLPDSQGLSTLKQLSHIKTPKIVLTACDSCEEGAIRLGAVDYIPKSHAADMCERIKFNMRKLVKRPRFSSEVFGQIRAYIEMPNRELVGAS